MAKKPPLGSGQRFASLTAKLANEPGVRNPAAVAASIGRKKYGAKKMGQLSHHSGDPGQDMRGHGAHSSKDH